MDLVATRYFVETVRAGTITRAAALLGLSRPTLSRRLTALEEELGLALLHRTTRAVRPTRAGRRLYERMQPVLRDLAEVEASLLAEANTVNGCLTLSIPPPMAPEITRLLVKLCAEHPALEVDLRVDVRMADLRDEVEVALRAGPSNDQELVQRKITSRPVRALAARSYLERAGRPVHIDDLASHTLLMERGGSGDRRTSWPLQDGGRVAVQGTWTTNDQTALLHATRAGGGIALMNEVSYLDALEAGELELVLPNLVGAELPVVAVFARRTLQPARVRAFLDAAVAWYAIRPGASSA